MSDPKKEPLQKRVGRAAAARLKKAPAAQQASLESAVTAAARIEASNSAVAAVVAQASAEASAVRLTRYERTQVIGIRAEQLARGALAFVDVPLPAPGDDYSEPVSMYDVAERELAAGRLPFIIVRHMPDGGTQHVRLCSAANAAKAK